MCDRTLYEEYGKDYIGISTYFELLNGDLSHYDSSNDICTPMALVKEMVDKIPKELWKRDKLKVLDCCCGNGNFLAYIGTKTKLDNLYFNEINEKRIVNCKKFFGDDIHLTKKDFLEFDDNEEYDLVVANPPYAKFTDDGKRTAKNHNLSRDFIKKALNVTKRGGYILFIVPDNWMSYSDCNDLPLLLSQYQFRYLSVHTPKKYFPTVGSTFTYFVLQKTPNKEPFTIANGYKLKDTQTVTLDVNSHFIPLYYSPIVKSIMDKTVNNENVERYNVETSSDLHKHSKGKYFSPQKDDTHKYKIWHTPRQCFYSSIPHKYQNGWKVFISLTTQYETFIDDCGATQSIAFIRCKDKNEAKKINKELQHPIYKFINNLTRYGNFGNNRIWQRMPVLSSVSLTNEELNFVKNFNDLYDRKIPSSTKKVDGKNKTEQIVESVANLEKEVNFSTYDYRDNFVKLCDLHPNKDREQLEIINMNKDLENSKGLIYIMVINDKIFKIGQTTVTFKERLSSYNCGSNKARKKGTCSVTNHYILQSFLAMNVDVEVYIYVLPEATYEYFGEVVHSSEAPSKYTERRISAEFEKKYYKKPIGCIQE